MRKLHQRTYTQMEEATVTTLKQLRPPLSPLPVPGQSSAANQSCLRPPSSRGDALRSLRAVSTATIFRYRQLCCRCGRGNFCSSGCYNHHTFSVTG